MFATISEEYRSAVIVGEKDWHDVDSLFGVKQRWCADMGGRGAYSEGKQKEYVFKKAGEIDGVKVLVPVDEKASHNMPAEAHSSKAYIVLDKKNDVFRQYREFIEVLFG